MTGREHAWSPFDSTVRLSEYCQRLSGRSTVGVLSDSCRSILITVRNCCRNVGPGLRQQVGQQTQRRAANSHCLCSAHRLANQHLDLRPPSQTTCIAIGVIHCPTERSCVSYKVTSHLGLCTIFFTNGKHTRTPNCEYVSVCTMTSQRRGATRGAWANVQLSSGWGHNCSVYFGSASQGRGSSSLPLECRQHPGWPPGESLQLHSVTRVVMIRTVASGKSMRSRIPSSK